MAQHTNTTGSLAFNGQVNEGGYSRGTKQWDHNQSGLTPVTTGSRTNLKGNQGGLADINGDQPIIGGAATPRNKGREDGTGINGQSIRGGRTNQRGNQ